MPRKLTIDEIKKEIVNIHPTITIISNEYHGTNEPIMCKCTVDGYEWISSWSDLQRKTRLCPVCNTTKNLNIDILKLKLEKINPNIEIIDNIYIDSDTKIKCKCKIDGQEWSAAWTNLKKGSGCPQCKSRLISDKKTLTIDEIKQRLKIINEDIKILSDNYVRGDIELKCQCLICNHTWGSTWYNLRSGSGCPICARKKIRESQSFTLVEIKEKLKSINPNVAIMSNEYINCKEKIKCKCLICNNEWEITWDNLSSGRGCPQCSESKGEGRIREFLKSEKIDFIQEYSFNDLIGVNGGLLRFDFALLDKENNLRLLIEYDGEFHFEKQYRADGFETLQIHDKLKDQYCESNNIKLLRIPYWEFDNIKKILLNNVYILQKEGVIKV